jgi:hypothetical protein
MILALAALCVLPACSSVMLEPGDHGQALHKALEAQRLVPKPAAVPAAQTVPVPPAAVELKGALENHLLGRTPAAGSSLTPALGDTLR